MFFKKLMGSIFSLIILLLMMAIFMFGTIVHFDINNTIARIFIVAFSLLIADKSMIHLSAAFIGGDMKFLLKFLMAISFGACFFICVILMLKP
jgi:hypothetical protein